MPDLEAVLASLPEQQELRQLSSAHARKEFGLGRYLFHQVTGEQTPLERGPQGEPLWPANVSGSLSHSKGRYFLALGHHPIGLDVEEIDRVTEKLDSKIFTPEDKRLQKHLCSYASSIQNIPSELFFRALVFTAKEATYKCIFPWKKTKLGFRDAHLSSVDLDRETFRVQIPSLDQKLRGQFKALNLERAGPRLLCALVFP